MRIAHPRLPVEVTSFVGREPELAEIRELLPTTRLLTLSGSGGCGKTRLALKVGEMGLGDFADGVWLVELASVTDPGLVAHEVAATLGIHEEPGRLLSTTLAVALGARQLLLILD